MFRIWTAVCKNNHNALQQRARLFGCMWTYREGRLLAQTSVTQKQALFLSLWACEAGWNSAQHSCSVKPEESGSVIWAQQLLHAFIPPKKPNRALIYGGIAPVGIKPAVLAAWVPCSVHFCLWMFPLPAYLSVLMRLRAEMCYPQGIFQTQINQKSSQRWNSFHN